MGWLGKIIGGGVGFILGGPLGAIIGASIGHGADSLIDSEDLLGSNEESEELYFKYIVNLVSLMGKIAACDGPVSEKEIKYFKEKFLPMIDNLDKDKYAHLTGIFITASEIEADTDISVYSHNMFDLTEMEEDRARSIIILLIELALSDGGINSSENSEILEVAKVLGVSEYEYLELKKSYELENSKYYRILKCTVDDSNEKIKKQYKMLVKEFHPDVLKSKNLPEDVNNILTKRFNEIKEAYEYIKKERGMEGGNE